MAQILKKRAYFIVTNTKSNAIFFCQNTYKNKDYANKQHTRNETQISHDQIKNHPDQPNEITAF